MPVPSAAQKSYDVVALGELLIDFTESGSSPQGHPLFEANPGGAPCNVLAMLSRLGRRTAFLGKVGDDGFGAQLRAAVTAAGIDAGGLVADPTVPTTLAFVQTLAGGERSFSFYRSPGADTPMNTSAPASTSAREPVRLAGLVMAAISSWSQLRPSRPA